MPSILRARQQSDTLALTASDVETASDLMDAIKQPAQNWNAACSDENMAAVPAEKEHALLPLLRKLVAMTAEPGRLLAALVEEFDGLPDAPGDYASVLAKAIVFQRRELEELRECWPAIHGVAALQHDSVASSGDAALHGVILKATVYYWRLWEFVVATCVDAVVRRETGNAQTPRGEWTGVLTKRDSGSISPSSDDRDSDIATSVMTPSSSGGMAKRPRLTRQSNEFMIGWFLAHKTNPYPSRSERAQIAERTGLTEQQVRNWFANMRKRHWKPSRPNTKKPRCLLDYVLRKQDQ